jgi:prefoldin beta subunit
LSKGLSPQLEDKFKRYQKLQQDIANIQQQIQAFGRDKIEIETAMKEIEELPDDEMCYRSIGRLMVKSTIKETKVKLNDQKEIADTRVKFLEKNFEKLKKQFDELEKELRTAIEGK